MTRSNDEIIVRAAVSAPADLPMDVVTQVGDRRTFELLTAASAFAVVRKFADKPDQARIREFVESLQARFPDAAQFIKPIIFEAFIRFAFGEDSAIDGIDSEGLRHAVFLLPYAIITEENIFGEPLDAFVAEVVAAVNVAE